MLSSKSTRIITFLLFVYVIFIVWNLSVNVNSGLWDSKAYFYSTISADQNLNPYNAKDLSVIAQKDWLTPYAYPPLTLYFFKIFSVDNAEIFAVVFLLFKMILLIILVLLWQKILKIKSDPIFYLFILLSFNSAVFIDLRTGNVSIIIQLLLWTGIFFYLRKEYILFCLFVLMAAAFKLIPVIFLLLLLFTGDKRKYKLLIGSSLAFMLYLLLNYLMFPQLFNEFTQSAINNLNGMGKGITHPALFSFVRDALKELYIYKVRELVGFKMISVIELLIFISVISVICIITFRSLKTLNDEKNILNTDKGIILVSLFCILFSLIMPRFKDYDYILLILPSYFIISRSGFADPKFLLVFIFIISSVKVTLPGINVFYGILWDYYPLFLAIIIWILYMQYIKKPADILQLKTTQGRNP